MEDFLSIKGDFETSSIPELLYSTYKSKETGILKCSRLKMQKSLYLREGKIVSAASNDPDDRLGESLLKYGDISVTHYMEASKLISSDRKLGNILLDLGAISAEHLVESLKRQVIDIVYSIFQWKTGEYELVLTELENERVVLFDLPMEPLIYNGVKQINYWSKISNGLSSILNVPVKAPDADRILMNLSLDAEENHVYSLFNEMYDIQSICNMSYLSNLETCKIIWALKVIGVITLTSKKTETTIIVREGVEAEYELMDIVDSYNEALMFVYEFVNQRFPEEVDKILDTSIQQVNKLYNNRLVGMDLNYGRVDFDSILHNFSDLSPADRRKEAVDILEELLYTLIMQSKTCLVPADYKLLLTETARHKK